ncbi:dentin sialophosphoprotein-like [Argopecten irradians]|uniref:dentin sialophosphoprotein-like n=1 Tax=Argopecten irradians TaxID=31199 RepID=UPI003713241C
MEGNLRRGRPTLCISEAFDFLNNPEYGDKSGKDADQGLKKSVSDTGLLTGNHHNDKNTYTILTFVQGDQSDTKTAVTKSFKDNVDFSSKPTSNKEHSNTFTVVTCGNQPENEQIESRSKENSVINSEKCNQLQPSNHQSYLPASNSQSNSRLPVGAADLNSREIITQEVETTSSISGEGINPQHRGPSEEQVTNQNRSISINNSQSILPSANPILPPYALIQNGVSKSVINICNPKLNQNDRRVDLVTSPTTDSQSNQQITEKNCQPDDGVDLCNHDDDEVVLRPPSLTSPTRPSRRTQQVISEAFQYLKEYDDLNDLGEEELEPNSNDTFEPEVLPELTSPNKEAHRVTRKNSRGEAPPTILPKPKRPSSAAQKESVCSNGSHQPEPVSPLGKGGPKSPKSPKSPPAVAPKPRRSSQGLKSPCSPVQENSIEVQGMENHIPNTGQTTQNPVITTDNGLDSEDHLPNSTIELPSQNSDFNIEKVSSDQSVLKDKVSLTSDLDIVTSDLNIDGKGKGISPQNETDKINSDETQDSVPSSPVKMRPSLSRSEAIDDSSSVTETSKVKPVELEPEQTLTLRRKKSRSRTATNDEDSADSSDDDTGIYNESYRNSCWIQLADQDSRTESPTPLMSQTVEEPITEHPNETEVQVEEEKQTKPAHQDSKDEVFVESVPYKEGRYHKRSDSTTTTRSESEFKREYQFRRKCFVQRSDSQQEYHRLSAKFYDHERVIVIQRTEPTSDLGLHILDSHPAVITSVDPESPAEKAGVKKGQIILSVNQVNVLQTSHAEIVSLIQDSSLQVTLEVASSDVSLVRDLQSPKVSGYMYKLSNSSFVRNWKKRYFVLRKDNCLYYYKNDQDCTDPLGALPLLNYTVSKYTDTSKSHCFKAEKYGAKTYYFYVDTREDMARWVCAMNEAAMVSKKRKESWMDITSHNVGLPALEIRRAECTGYLRKSNKAMKNWNKRYCVLKDACLYYYKSMNSQNAQGMAHLHGYRVDVTGIPVKPFSFILQPPEDQMRTFYFVAENETDKMRWVESLRKSVDRWIKVD